MFHNSPFGIKSLNMTYSIDFCYTWIPSLAHVHPKSILLDLAKHCFSIIWRSSKKMNFPKIWRLWLKNCARHAHFNFELLKGVAALILKPHPWTLDKYAFFIDKKLIFLKNFCISNRILVVFKSLPKPYFIQIKWCIYFLLVV